jgi:hypothetical protein
LHKNGRIFLVDAFQGNEKLADSVNHLLVVGFYLINIGCVSLALKYGEPARVTQQAIEYLSGKVGLVVVIFGVMHFFNLLVLSKWRKSATDRLSAREESNSHFNRVRDAVPVERSAGGKLFASMPRAYHPGVKAWGREIQLLGPTCSGHFLTW